MVIFRTYGPFGVHFGKIKEYIDKDIDRLSSWGFWYDYSCIPQKENGDKRSDQGEEVFKRALKVMHLLPMLSSTIALFDENYIGRTWCAMEWVCTTNCTPLPTNNGNNFPVPFGNVIKFKHLAIVAIFLLKDAKLKIDFMGSENEADTLTQFHINSLITNLIFGTAASLEEDKNLIVSLLYEHFWHHVRYLGFRTVILHAFLIFDKLSRDTISSLFYHFVLLTNDPLFEWTKRITVIAESIIPTGPTPTDSVFHRNFIEVKPRSEIYKKRRR